MDLLIEVHYLPSLEYFCCLLSHEHLSFEQYEYFTKQTYRNRCYIRGANKVQDLRIPVKKGKSKTLIKDLQVDAGQAWQQMHWRSMVSAYGNAPFFAHYAPELEKILLQKRKFLFDYTLPILTLCLDWLEIRTPREFTSGYTSHHDNHVLDARNMISPKKLYTSRPFYQPVPYPQVFGKDFAENLSVLDLFACEGPNARMVLDQSVKH